jgi:hypothetical protein
MTFSNDWMELRGRLLPPKRGRSATDLRAAALRRWLRSCAADPSCTVTEAARRLSAAAEERPAEPSPEWLELREDLLPAEGVPGPDHPGWEVADRLAAIPESCGGLSLAAEDLLARLSLTQRAVALLVPERHPPPAGSRRCARPRTAPHLA